MQLCTLRVYRGTRIWADYVGAHRSRNGVWSVRVGQGGRGGADFLRFAPLLTHVQLHNSIVVSIRTPLSPGFPLHPFGEGQRDGSEKFALTSFLKLDFDGEREGKVDFDVKRAPWNKHSRARTYMSAILFALRCARICMSRRESVRGSISRWYDEKARKYCERRVDSFAYGRS